MNSNQRQTNMTHREVAKAMGLTRGTIQTIEKSAIKKIKQALAERGIKPQDLFKD